uniref:Uncharacterized protein n=1 Tax=Solanum tuberosum TaxID=4113 RepID=M1D8Q2_SOLTU
MGVMIRHTNLDRVLRSGTLKVWGIFRWLLTDLIQKISDRIEFKDLGFGFRVLLNDPWLVLGESYLDVSPLNPSS